jgi:hypothetical protein
MSGTAALFTEPARKGAVRPWAGDFRLAAGANSIKDPVGQTLTLEMPDGRSATVLVQGQKGGAKAPVLALLGEGLAPFWSTSSPATCTRRSIAVRAMKRWQLADSDLAATSVTIWCRDRPPRLDRICRLFAHQARPKVCDVSARARPGGTTVTKPIDYDSPRRPGVELDNDGLDDLKARPASARSRRVDLDEAEAAEGFELPGADLSDEELTVAVVPIQSDEFRCSRCFLVRHRGQLAARRDGQDICQECS